MDFLQCYLCITVSTIHARELRIDSLQSLLFPIAAIVCTALSVPDNGLISYSPDTTPPFDYLTTATYDCNTGFALSGSIPRTLAVCEDLNGGEWVGGRYTCERELCFGGTLYEWSKCHV